MSFSSKYYTSYSEVPYLSSEEILKGDLLWLRKSYDGEGGEIPEGDKEKLIKVYNEIIRERNENIKGLDTFSFIPELSKLLSLSSSYFLAKSTFPFFKTVQLESKYWNKFIRVYEGYDMKYHKKILTIEEREKYFTWLERQIYNLGLELLKSVNKNRFFLVKKYNEEKILSLKQTVESVLFNPNLTSLKEFDNYCIKSKDNC
ncbi:hypothetical protein MWU59_02670 [Flavobacteriaceae bacterium F08102]|nr:hypothetical protein [Flavobacteriaceae bacterium F08102]